MENRNRAEQQERKNTKMIYNNFTSLPDNHS